MYTYTKLSVKVANIRKITVFYTDKYSGCLLMMDISGKYLYTIRSANGVLVENLQVFGKSRTEADEKIRQMYWRCEIISCDMVVKKDSKARTPHIKMQWVRP